MPAGAAVTQSLTPTITRIVQNSSSTPILSLSLPYPFPIPYSLSLLPFLQIQECIILHRYSSDPHLSFWQFRRRLERFLFQALPWKDDIVAVGLARGIPNFKGKKHEHAEFVGVLERCRGLGWQITAHVGACAQGIGSMGTQVRPSR